MRGNAAGSRPGAGRARAERVRALLDVPLACARLSELTGYDVRAVRNAIKVLDIQGYVRSVPLDKRPIVADRGGDVRPRPGDSYVAYARLHTCDRPPVPRTIYGRTLIEDRVYRVLLDGAEWDAASMADEVRCSKWTALCALRHFTSAGKVERAGKRGSWAWRLAERAEAAE